MAKTSTNPAPTAPAPASAPSPPPASGIQPAFRALPPAQVEPSSTAPNPAKELAAREKAAIDSRNLVSAKAALAAAGEGAAPPKASTPPAGAKPAGSQQPVGTGASTSTKKVETASAELPAPGKTSEAPAAEAEAQPRINLKTLKRWVEENPELGAEAREIIFKADKDSTAEWIKLKAHERKLREKFGGEREKTLSEAKAERDAAAAERAQVDGVVQKLSPIADMWEAVAEGIRKNPEAPVIDFEMADAAFEQNAGVSIDDYMRLRARRGIGQPGDARVRAENARLKRELAAQTNGAAGKSPAQGTTAATDVRDAAPAAPAARKEPKAAEIRDWSPELPKDHKLRKIDGWNALLDKEMSKYRDDLDEHAYSKDPEEVAAKVLKRALAELADEEEEEAPKPKPRARIVKAEEPEAKPRKKPIAQLPDDDADEAPKDFAKRERWAIERAQKRARGELVD